MRLTLENTAEIVELSPRFAAEPERDRVVCRVWRGTTDAGVPVHALIALVGVEREQDQTAFERELLEREPHAAARVFPTRLVL